MPQIAEGDDAIVVAFSAFRYRSEQSLEFGGGPTSWRPSLSR
jgi:hypothetical protein